MFNASSNGSSKFVDAAQLIKISISLIRIFLSSSLIPKFLRVRSPTIGATLSSQPCFRFGYCLKSVVKTSDEKISCNLYIGVKPFLALTII
jgi:hypothetical protein